MRVKAKVVGRISIPADSRVVLEHAQVRDQDYSSRNLMQFCAIGSRFEKCRFDKARIENASFGAGREMSEFIECSFDGARLTGGGGFARFVRCSFRNADLRHWLCLGTEFVDCVFSGRLRKCIFNGTVVPEPNRAMIGRERNEFRGNDFSEADLVEVDFRTGIDLTQQRLPSGPAYLYLPNPMPVIERSRAEVLGWRNFEHRRIALIILKTMEDQVAEGQQQLFSRASDNYGCSALPREAVDNLYTLLAANQTNVPPQEHKRHSN